MNSGALDLETHAHVSVAVTLCEIEQQETVYAAEEAALARDKAHWGTPYEAMPMSDDEDDEVDDDGYIDEVYVGKGKEKATIKPRAIKGLTYLNNGVHRMRKRKRRDFEQDHESNLVAMDVELDIGSSSRSVAPSRLLLSNGINLPAHITRDAAELYIKNLTTRVKNVEPVSLQEARRLLQHIASLPNDWIEIKFVWQQKKRKLEFVKITVPRGYYVNVFSGDFKTDNSNQKIGKGKGDLVRLGNKEQRCLKYHVIMSVAFPEQPPVILSEIDHIDGTHGNNCILNLRRISRIDHARVTASNRSDESKQKNGDFFGTPIKRTNVKTGEFETFKSLTEAANKTPGACTQGISECINKKILVACQVENCLQFGIPTRQLSRHIKRKHAHLMEEDGSIPSLAMAVSKKRDFFRKSHAGYKWEKLPVTVREAPPGLVRTVVYHDKLPVARKLFLEIHANERKGNFPIAYSNLGELLSRRRQWTIGSKAGYNQEQSHRMYSNLQVHVLIFVAFTSDDGFTRYKESIDNGNPLIICHKDGNPKENRWNDHTYLEDGSYSNYACTLTFGSYEDNQRDASYYHFLTKYKSAFEAFFKEYGHLAVPRNHEQLGSIVSGIRSRKYYPMWHAWLEKRGWIWDATSFKSHMQHPRRKISNEQSYKLVVDLIPKLGANCGRGSSNYLFFFHPNVTVDDLLKYHKSNFTEQFEIFRAYCDLQQFKEDHGHLLVPQLKKTELYSLGKTVNGIRCRKINPHLHKAITELGFIWDALYFLKHMKEALKHVSLQRACELVVDSVKAILNDPTCTGKRGTRRKNFFGFNSNVTVQEVREKYETLAKKQQHEDNNNGPK